MKTLIIEIPVAQTNEEADAAWALETINGGTFVSLQQVKEKLLSLDIDKSYNYTVANLISHVNNGNDSFSDSYLAEVFIDK